MKKTKTLLTSLAILLAISSYAQGPTVGNFIQGDYNGDGQKEVAFHVQTVKGEGNPMDDGTADEFVVYFTSLQLDSIPVGCCSIELINEGDLNGDGRDDLSIFHAPMNGNTFSMTTYSFIDGSWKVIIDTFLIPTGGDFLNYTQLQKRIFKEKDVVYFYDVDANDENFKLVKTKVVFK